MDVLTVLQTMDPGEPYTAGDLADELDYSREWADKRLRELFERGLVTRKKHSTGHVSWMVRPDAQMTLFDALDDDRSRDPIDRAHVARDVTDPADAFEPGESVRLVTVLAGKPSSLDIVDARASDDGATVETPGPWGGEKTISLPARPLLHGRAVTAYDVFAEVYDPDRFQWAESASGRTPTDPDDLPAATHTVFPDDDEVREARRAAPAR